MQAAIEKGHFNDRPRSTVRPSPLQSPDSVTHETLPSSELNPGADAVTGSDVPQWLTGYGSEKFIVQSVLGVGGMGVVYRARHALMNCDIALKVVRPEYAQNPEVIERFFREARALSALNSPGIVRVLDCDVTADGCPFIAMELLEGQDLRSVLERHGRLAISKALGVLYETAKAMAHAHASGIVHRDLKPENVFLDTRAGRRPAQVKVIDFGVVRNLSDFHSITIVGNALGSVYYMAPEQIEDSHDVDARADVWSLGVILYECLTGQLPFQAKSQLAVSSVILHAEPEDVRIRCPQLPKAVAELVHRCLQKDPSKRFANARELADALCRCGGHLSGIRSSSRAPSPESSPPASARATSVPEPAAGTAARVSSVKPRGAPPVSTHYAPHSPSKPKTPEKLTLAALAAHPSLLVLLGVFVLSLTVGAALAKGITTPDQGADLLSSIARTWSAIGPSDFLWETPVQQTAANEPQP